MKLYKSIKKIKSHKDKIKRLKYLWLRHFLNSLSLYDDTPQNVFK